jgi:hypothetical protein
VANNPWSRVAKPKPKGKLKLLGGKAKTNGVAPVKPSLAALSKGKPTQVTPKPKPTLRSLVTTEPVVMERPHQEPKERVKEDFRVGGVLFSGAEVTDKVSVGHRDGTFRSVGTVDVTNGDQTYTLHNRYGSWMHDVWGTANMAEPARVAAWLGINMSQLDMCQLLTKRFEAELKKQGIPNKQQQRAKIEADAAKARKRTKQPEKETPVVTPKKPSLRGLKGKK